MNPRNAVKFVLVVGGPWSLMERRKNIKSHGAALYEQ